MLASDPNRLPLRFFAVGIFSVVLGTYYVATGTIQGRYGRNNIERDANPFQFWLTVALFYGAGAGSLIYFFYFYFWVYKY